MSHHPEFSSTSACLIAECLGSRARGRHTVFLIANFRQPGRTPSGAFDLSQPWAHSPSDGTRGSYARRVLLSRLWSSTHTSPSGQQRGPDHCTESRPRLDLETRVPSIPPRTQLGTWKDTIAGAVQKHNLDLRYIVLEVAFEGWIIPGCRMRSIV